jgi:NitT/TauT family transport system permease protein
MGFIIGIVWVTKQMNAPFHFGESIPISLNPRVLPSYALQTVSRMLVAFVCSLLFTFVIGTLAARSKHAERVIIPIIDILQSIPVLGFLTFTVTFFIALFPSKLLGPECASMFVIFTAQVWNMTLGFYQSLRTIPTDFVEAAAMLQLSAWQRFWRVEVPFAIPSLAWNSMMSMSGSWVFLVYSEAISVGNQSVNLPGIGSYIGLATQQKNIHAVFYVIITMFMVILLYDQFLFRPLVAWADKFKMEQDENEEASPPWITILLRRTYVLRHIGKILSICGDFFINFHLFNPKPSLNTRNLSTRASYIMLTLWYITLIIAITLSLIAIAHFIFSSLTTQEALHVVVLGGYTCIRVLVSIVICSLIWVPLGVWIGLRPKIARIAQPIAQFLAAFPMNLLFPITVMSFMRFKLNPDIWTTPLMILGTQWYVLFNVIAGASALPKDLYYAANNLGVKGLLWWRKLVLPGIFPYYITGALTAAGGAWNISILTEFLQWGKQTIHATGIGDYLATYSQADDTPRVFLSVCVMCFFVILLNHVIWRPLYNLAEKRYKIL